MRTGQATNGEATFKQSARDVVALRRPDLVALSEAIHADPELCWDEHRSSARVADAMADSGFTVERGVCDIPTAMRATYGSGPLVIALCAEYDALPSVGHACGHNLIAASAVGAALALAPLADELGLTVQLVGTPAEEGGGGKILLLDRGAFDGVHAAMMVHPWPEDRLGATCLAVAHFEVRYAGRQAHASAAPEQGVNAADAMTVAQVAIGLLRQHFRPGDQVHGITTKGGDAPNIVPSDTAGEYMVRARSLDELALLEPRITRCFEAGALATGSRLEVKEIAPPYSEFIEDADLLRLWRLNAEALGRKYGDDDSGTPRPTISTDMANVSLVVPAIHPLIGLDSHGAVNHQAEFADACVGSSADKALTDGAVGMAWTAIDVARDANLRQRLLARS